MLRLGDWKANYYHKMGESLKTRLAVKSEPSSPVHSHGAISTEERPQSGRSWAPFTRSSSGVDASVVFLPSA